MSNNKYYRVFNGAKKAYWLQSKYGYTTCADEAGWWSDSEIELIGLDCDQILEPYFPSVLALRLRNIQSFNELKKIADEFREK